MKQIEELRKLAERDRAGDFAYAQPVAYGPHDILTLLGAYDALVESARKIIDLDPRDFQDTAIREDGFMPAFHEAIRLAAQGLERAGAAEWRDE